MRKLSGAAVAMILGVTLYFTVAWGFEALRMLASPTYGLDDTWRSHYVFAIGGLLGLSPLGLLKLAAFFAALKLAVAGICAIHIADRLRSLAGGSANTQVLEAALILVVAISILTVGPAVWSQDVGLVREYTIQLVLAGLAAAFCALERGRAAVAATEEAAAAAAASESATEPQGAAWFAPWR
jgi:hypothetical protein